MTRVEDRLAQLFEKKADEVQDVRRIPDKVARSAARARFVRKTRAPALAVAGLSVLAAVAGASLRAPETERTPAAGALVPAPQLSGTNGANEWRLTALSNGSEHCVIVRISYEGREIDTSNNCGVHVGDVEPDMGPGISTVEGGGGTLALLGQVGPSVDSVAVETEAGRTVVRTIPIPWDTPPATRFYISFFPETDVAAVSTYDADGELLEEVQLDIIDGDARVRE